MKQTKGESSFGLLVDLQLTLDNFKIIRYDKTRHFYPRKISFSLCTRYSRKIAFRKKVYSISLLSTLRQVSTLIYNLKSKIVTEKKFLQSVVILITIANIAKHILAVSTVRLSSFPLETNLTYQNVSTPVLSRDKDVCCASGAATTTTRPYTQAAEQQLLISHSAAVKLLPL